MVVALAGPMPSPRNLFCVKRFNLFQEILPLSSQFDDIVPPVTVGRGANDIINLFHPVNERGNICAVNQHHLAEPGLAETAAFIGLVTEHHHQIKLNGSNIELTQKISTLLLDAGRREIDIQKRFVALEDKGCVKIKFVFPALRAAH